VTGYSSSRHPLIAPASLSCRVASVQRKTIASVRLYCGHAHLALRNEYEALTGVLMLQCGHPVTCKGCGAIFSCLSSRVQAYERRRGAARVLHISVRLTAQLMDGHLEKKTHHMYSFSWTPSLAHLEVPQRGQLLCECGSEVAACYAANIKGH